MTANPIDLVGGLTTSASVPKADVTAWAKARVPQVMASVTEVRNTVLASQLVITIKATGGFWFLDSTDTTTADDGVSCLVSSDGKRFKLLGVPLPTAARLGGVLLSSAPAHQFATGVDASGNILYHQPAFADVSGNIAVGQINGGSGATASTFLRGDGTWSASGVVAPTDLNLSGTPGGASPRIASYTDSARVFFGREYLGAWINSWRTGGGPTANILMRGDSTIVGTGLSSPTVTTPDILFKALALRRGLRIIPTNLGVSGTTTADWLNTHLPSDLATYTGGNIPKLYILNYGMNDPDVGPISQAQTITNLRAGFALLRTTWSPDQTSIVYMMPNTAYDDANGRNETWREQVVQRIKEACRDYSVMFFDTYAALREARYGLLTGWLNATDKVHPADDFNVAIWGYFTEAVIGAGISDLACRPLPASPASGYTLPGSAEDMQTTVAGDMVIGNGYISKTTPGTIGAGATLATVHAYHTPLTQAFGVQMAAWDGTNWQFFHGVITTGGVITNREAITLTTTRIYFGPGIWKH